MKGHAITARALLAAALILCALTGVPAAFGQATDGNLVGTVTDPAGAVVPAANVKV